MKKLRQRFTLFVLIKCYAVLRILHSFPTRRSSDLMIRSKMSEVAAALSACKTSVSEYAAARNTWPGNVDQAGCSTQATTRAEGHTSELASRRAVACRNLLDTTTNCSLTLTAQGTAA